MNNEIRTLLALTGYGQSPRRLRRRAGLDELAAASGWHLATPWPPRGRWIRYVPLGRDWRPSDCQFLAELLDQLPAPVLVWGFSDSAEPAAYAAAMRPQRVAGMAWIAGPWHQRVEHQLGLWVGDRLPWPLAVCVGLKDRFPTRARACYDWARTLRPPPTAGLLEHPGGHLYGRLAAEALRKFFDP